MRNIVCFFCFLFSLSFSQAQTVYQLIDQHHSEFSKNLSSNTANNHFGLLERYIEMKVTEWKDNHPNSTVVVHPMDTSFSELIIQAKKNAFIQNLLSKQYQVAGFMDIFSKTVEGKNKKYNIYEAYEVRWDFLPVYNSIKMTDYELLPGGLVLFAFSFENFKTISTDSALVLNLFCNQIEKNDRLFPSYFFEVLQGSNNWLSNYSSNYYLQAVILSEVKQWSEMANKNFNTVQGVTDQYQNKIQKMTNDLTRVSGEFVMNQIKESSPN